MTTLAKPLTRKTNTVLLLEFWGEAWVSVALKYKYSDRAKSQKADARAEKALYRWMHPQNPKRVKNK